jgi:hypothetical protein
MANMRLLSGPIVAVLLAAGQLPACAKSSGQTEMAKRAAETHGEVSQTTGTRVTVEDIDTGTRTIAMRDAEGNRFMVEAGKNVRLDRLHPGDVVKVEYRESVAFQLQDPDKKAGSETEGVSEQATQTQGPTGTELGRTIQATVQIVAVSPEGKRATIRTPDGEIRTVAIEDPKNQEKVATLQPGDSVEVTYTERLALALDESESKAEQ